MDRNNWNRIIEICEKLYCIYYYPISLMKFKMSVKLNFRTGIDVFKSSEHDSHAILSLSHDYQDQ